MEDLKQLVEDIIEYTGIWSICENEWYWNVACLRKSNNTDNEEITWEEFEVAIREEILYDLIFNNGVSISNQMRNDLGNYVIDFDGEENYNMFIEHNKKIENNIREFIKDFKVNRDF